MCRIKVTTALFAVSALFSASGISIAADPPPRPEKYFVPFSAPQNFIDHARYFKEEAIKVGPYNIWSINTPNGGIGNVIVLESDSGVVLIDTSVGVEHAERARELMLTLTKKPVVAVVYTHHHADHTAGTTAFVSREDAASGKVKIIAADNFMSENEQENGATGPIMGLRASYMYGVALPPDAEGTHYHIGCCGFKVTGTNGFIAPNTFVPRDRVTEITRRLPDAVLPHRRRGGEPHRHLSARTARRLHRRRGAGPDLPAAPLAARHKAARHRPLGHRNRQGTRLQRGISGARPRPDGHRRRQGSGHR